MKKLALSERVQKLRFSPIRGLVNLAKEQEKKGVKVHFFNIGQPDLPSPKRFYQEVQKYNEKVVAYAPSQGRKEAQEAWCKYLKDAGISFKPEETIVTQGGVEALFLAQAALLDPEDDMLVFEPFYPYYQSQAKILGHQIVPITLKLENNFHLPPISELQKKVTPRTKAILVNNPCNPTGTIFTPQEIRALAKFAKKNKLFIIADEVYREYAFERPALSMCKIPEVKNQVILCDTASKRFNLCGARIGVLASHNKDLMSNVLKLAQARESVATIEQLAVIPLLNDAKKYYGPTIAEYKKRREVIYSELVTIPEIKVSKPEGAFYIMIGLPVKDAEHFAAWVISDFRYENQTICVAPAQGFYYTKGAGQDEIRMTYVVDIPTIKKGVTVLRYALEAYRKKFPKLCK